MALSGCELQLVTFKASAFLIPPSSTNYLSVRDDQVDGLIHDNGHKCEDERFVYEKEGPDADPEWSSAVLKFPKYIPAIPPRSLIIII